METHCCLPRPPSASCPDLPLPHSPTYLCCLPRCPSAHRSLHTLHLSSPYTSNVRSAGELCTIFHQSFQTFTSRRTLQIISRSPGTPTKNDIYSLGGIRRHSHPSITFLHPFFFLHIFAGFVTVFELQAFCTIA